jgi:hypothetical protein
MMAVLKWKSGKDFDKNGSHLLKAMFAFLTQFDAKSA